VYLFFRKSLWALFYTTGLLS